MAPKQKKRPLHVALIGTGAQGALLGLDCLNLDGVHIDAFCDVLPDNLTRFARLLHREGTPRAYGDLKVLLAKETALDAVIIATPDFLHARQTIDCLNAGLHVYCEAPMAFSLAQAEAMMNAAANNDRQLQIGYQRRSNPRYIKIVQEAIRNKKVVGDLARVKCSWNTPARRANINTVKTAPDFRDVAAYGFDGLDHLLNWKFHPQYSLGGLGQRISHQLDVAAWAYDADASSAIGSGDREPFGTSMNILEYKTDARNRRAVFMHGAGCSHGEYREDFACLDGYALTSEDISLNNHIAATFRRKNNPFFNNMKGESEDRYSCRLITDPLFIQRSIGLRCGEAAWLTRYTLPTTPPLREGSPCIYHLENFFAAIRGESELNAPPRIGYAALKAALACVKSIRDGRKIEM